MKKCTRCGKEYPDEAAICACDQQPLVALGASSASQQEAGPLLAPPMTATHAHASHITLRQIAGIVLFIGAAIMPILAICVTFMMPEWYAATARVLPAVTEPTAIATEVAIIRSQAVLLPVGTNLNLGRKYAEKYNLGEELRVDLLYYVLSQRCVIKQTRGTRLIEITVSSEDSREAAAIANEIALVYTKSPLAARGGDPKAVPQIIDRANASLLPVRPNKPLNLASGLGVGAVLAVIGLWLVLKGDVRRGRTGG
jgi:capsular polysaccharide biosynthesis protein